MLRLRTVTVLAGVAVLAAACGQSSSSSGGAGIARSAEPPAPAMPPEEVAKLVAALPAPYNTGDLAAGKLQFNKCMSCHTLAKGGPSMTGPNLYEIFGEKAGVRPGYSFSPAMKAATFAWDEAHMDQWIAKPMDMLPGTKMTFPGIKDPKQRIDMITYLKVATSGGPI